MRAFARRSKISGTRPVKTTEGKRDLSQSRYDSSALPTTWNSIRADEKSGAATSKNASRLVRFGSQLKLPTRMALRGTFGSMRRDATRRPEYPGGSRRNRFPGFSDSNVAKSSAVLLVEK